MKNRQFRKAFAALAGAIVFLIVSSIVVGAWHVRDVQKYVEAEFESALIARSADPVRAQIRELKSKLEIDQWITGSEDEVDRELEARGLSIKQDQRKGIVWFGDKLRTPISIVYIHGFSASRLELDPVIGKMAERIGAHVFYTRLKAHGLTNGEEFQSVRARDWAVDIEEALAIGAKIGDRVLVVAMSTAAPLALENYLRHIRDSMEGGSANSPNAIALAGMILLSPNFEPQALGTTLLEGSFGSVAARRLLGERRSFATANATHADRWTAVYRSEGLHAMMTAVASARRIDLAKVAVPVLTIYSKRDSVVDVAEIERRAKSFVGKGSAAVDWSGAARHELASATFSPEKIPELVELLVNWVSSAVAPKAQYPAAGNRE